MTQSQILFTINKQEYNLTIITKPTKLILNFNPKLPFVDDDDSEGEVVVKNEVSETIIKYLSFSDEELGKYSGLAIAENYRCQLIRALLCLWD
jgi:hypothetical protein